MLSRIHVDAGKDWVIIDREMEQLLEVADMTHRLTQGLYDPAGLPLLELWEGKQKNAEQPSEDEIRQALDLANWKAVQREPGKVILPLQGMGLEFGTLGKAYAVDMLVRIARQHGIKDALIHLGQHFYAIGNDGRHRGWKVDREHGFMTQNSFDNLILSDGGACWADHQALLLDRRTGRPVQQPLSAVAVLAPNCLTADIHANTMLILGQKEGLLFAQKTAGVEACLLSADGTMVSTPGYRNHSMPAADLPTAAPAPVQPKIVSKWIGRDLIRLWPWALPVVLLLVYSSRGLDEGFTTLVSAFSAWGTVWMTFFIARRLWGQYRAHAAATMLMVTLGTFSFGWLPLPDTLSCFLTLTSIAALVHQRAWAFFITLGLGLLLKDTTALLAPLSAALGWWLAGGLKPTMAWARGLALTLAVGVALLVINGYWQPAWMHRSWLDQPAIQDEAQPWWHLLSVPFLALMPWSFCTPRVLRQAWGRLRTGRLCTRHGLLLGWMLPPLALLMIKSSPLPTVALPLLPALVIVFCPPMIDVRRLWRIGASAVVLWLTLSLSSLSFPSAPEQLVVKPKPDTKTLREHDSQQTMNPLMHVSYSPPASTH